MISAIVIDNNPGNVSALASLLRNYCPQVELAGTADTAAAARELILAVRPQLIFLDIDLPKGQGFDLLRSLPELNAEVIFVSISDQYAIDAFRYAAMDYLLKPVNREHLELCVLRAETRIAEKISALNYELLLNNIHEEDPLKQNIVLTDKGQQERVSVASINYIIADGSYTHIYTDKRSYVSTRNLKDFERLLPALSFCRIHHGHIINITQIAKVQKGRGGTVYMKDGKILEISVRRKEVFMKMLQQQ